MPSSTSFGALRLIGGDIEGQTAGASGIRPTEDRDLFPVAVPHITKTLAVANRVIVPSTRRTEVTLTRASFRVNEHARSGYLSEAKVIRQSA
jgi:hypothetical protein